MSPIKTLIVEDEGLVAKDIRFMLENLGYDVTHAVSTGEEAVKKAVEKKPDLILMDIFLKGKMDGIEAAEKIHKLSNIPVIYLTAYADENTLQRAKITEPCGYLLKPFEEKDLHSTIETALYKHKMEKSLREREQWLSTILRSIGDAVIATNNNNTITFMNPIAELLTGWKSEKVLGKKVEDVFSIENNKTGIKKEKKEAKDTWIENFKFLNQAQLVCKGGKKVPIDHTSATVKDDLDKEIGSVLVFRDITKQKEAEEKLKQSWEKLQNALNGTIHAMALTVEMRDPYTAGHRRRVSEIAMAIATAMNLSEDQLEGIRTASLLHDIGKVHVPDKILSKPSGLAEAEFNLIKTHPQVGFEILNPIEFPWPVAEIVLQHHERMDGSGYPSGLSNKKILMEAKILGVSDVVEAMSSHRPYRPSLGIKKALSEISDKKGIIYDKKVVDACLNVFTKGIFKS